MKTYSELNDVETHIVREYQSWKKSDCDVAYKFEMLTQWRLMARDAEIEHLI